MTNERVISDTDLSSSLSKMAENTTAAELVRKQGQSKKVKVLSERKLMEWITALLNQHLASKADSFSDREKEELLAKTQEELAKRIQREQAADKERLRMQSELERVMSQISESHTSGAGMEQALATLRAQLAEVESARGDLEQDTYELQDQLQEKLNLLSTTLAEKDKLRDTVRNQMLRSNALVEGVLGLDNHYYANRHQEQNPVDEESGDDERFYHDFDIGAKVIQTLSEDLERLRAITGQLGYEGGDQRSLAQDLELLTQVRAGSLHAIDVAAPVSALAEALAGLRAEAEALDEDVSVATGGRGTPISALPDAEGDPSEVLAGLTAVVREMITELAKDRQRIAGLRNLTEEADATRHQTEEELELLRIAHRSLLATLAAKAPAAIAAVLGDEQADDAARLAAISELSTVPTAELEQTRRERDELRAAASSLEANFRRQQTNQQRSVARVVVEAARGDDQLADAVADLALGLDSESEPEGGFTRQITAAVESLSKRKQDLQRELAHARTEAERAKSAGSEVEVAIEHERKETQRLRREASERAAEITAATEEAATAAARVEHMRRELDEALAQIRDMQNDAEAAKADTAAANARIRELEARHAERIRTDKLLAGELLAVTKSDDLLADVATDLSVALDDHVQTSDIQQQLQKTVSAVAQRQQSLAVENSRLGRDSERLRAEVGEAKRSLADTQRSIAQAIVQAGRGDEDLKETVAPLESALDNARPGEPLSPTSLARLNDALTQLAERKRSLQGERDEMALNGKEIIGALTNSRDQRESELRALREDHEAAINRLAMLESRAAAAEAANRDLAEALSRAATTLPDDAAEPRIDLELALSQLPDEGEEGIDVPADVAPQIATHGARVAHALAERQAQAQAALTRSEAARERLQQELDERTANTARVSSELSSMRKELADARMLHVATENRAEALRQDLEHAQGEATAAAKALADARTTLDREHERTMTQADDLSLRAAEIDGLKVRIVNLEKQLNLSQADIAEHNARGGASADGLREEMLSLRRELANERDGGKAREGQLTELREKVESAEARIKRLREEFTKRLEERDNLIQQKDSQIDEIAAHKGDLSGLQAQITALTQQLAAAHTRVSELETATGASAGAASRHSTVGEDLKRTQAERDKLREQKRSFEADLAESNSVIDELKAQNEEKRKELLVIREQVQKALDLERTKTTALSDELGKLRAEKIGLEHKLRKLTEGK